MIEGYIIDLLRTNDCVIVPGFGGFLTHRETAKIVAQQREITPPRTGIIFNRGLDRNDGLLGHFLADKTSETFRQAQAKIDEAVNCWKKRLEAEKSLQIVGIGSFTLNEENKWQFAPAINETHFHNSFGLTKVELFAVAQAEQKTIKLASHYEGEIKTNRTISRGWVYGGLAAAAIAILAIFVAPQVQTLWRPAQNTATVKTIPQPAETPQPTAENNTFLEAVAAEKPAGKIELKPENNTFLEAVAALPANAEAAVSNTSTTLQAPNPDNSANVNSSQGGYYVIGGSFLKHNNAKKYARLLEKKGYKSQIIHNSNGFYNVSLVKEADTSSAVEQLNKLKIQENQQAWILKW